MFTGSSLILTDDGYRFLEDIQEPIQVICEYAVDGSSHFDVRPATVTKRDYEEHTTHLLTRSGRFISGDYASLWLLTNPKSTPNRTQHYQGVWRHWTDCAEAGSTDYAVMSNRGVSKEIELTKDDWLFYAYGYNNNDIPTDELPIPQATRADQRFIKMADRRQEWPDWYWYCTLAEKLLFLRGFYDAHGRITRRRIYLSCATDDVGRNLVIALSEFGIKASRFITQQHTWKHRKVEYVVDVRGLPSIRRLSERVCWYEPSMPSFRFAEIARHARRYHERNWQWPTDTQVMVTHPRQSRETLYYVDVDTAHTCTINGLIVRDSTLLA